MEHVGDIIERGLLDVAERKIRHGLSFSDAGITEITDLHARLVANLQLSVAVFLNGDLKSAQSLMSEKVAFRELEMRYADQHLLRLSDNTRQSIETSSLHLDLLADFKRINSLFCSVAYPILESAGSPVQDPAARRAAGSVPQQRNAHHLNGTFTDRHRAPVRDQGCPHVRGRTSDPAAARAAVGGTRRAARRRATNSCSPRSCTTWAT